MATHASKNAAAAVEWARNRQEKLERAQALRQQRAKANDGLDEPFSGGPAWQPRQPSLRGGGNPDHSLARVVQRAEAAIAHAEIAAGYLHPHPAPSQPHAHPDRDAGRVAADADAAAEAWLSSLRDGKDMPKMGRPQWDGGDPGGAPPGPAGRRRTPPSGREGDYVPQPGRPRRPAADLAADAPASDPWGGPSGLGPSSRGRANAPRSAKDSTRPGWNADFTDASIPEPPPAPRLNRAPSSRRMESISRLKDLRQRQATVRQPSPGVGPDESAFADADAVVQHGRRAGSSSKSRRSDSAAPPRGAKAADEGYGDLGGAGVGRGRPAPIGPSAAVQPPEQPEDAGDEALLPCSSCGRTFNARALERHAKICKGVFQQKRKVFDMKAQRLEGTEAAKAPSVGGRAGAPVRAGGSQRFRAPEEKPIKAKGQKKDWKAQSEQFRAAIRNARGVTEAIKNGVKAADIPYVPSAPDPSLVQCPHCGRRFNENAAERHIPKCKDIIAKPNFLKRGNGLAGGNYGKPEPQRAAKGVPRAGKW